MTVTTRDVTADEADIRLDRWFRRHYPWLTQGVLQKLCRTGQIRVNGARAEPNTRLAPNQTVRIPPSRSTITPPVPRSSRTPARRGTCKTSSSTKMPP